MRAVIERELRAGLLEMDFASHVCRGARIAVQSYHSLNNGVECRVNLDVRGIGDEFPALVFVGVHLDCKSVFHRGAVPLNTR